MKIDVFKIRLLILLVLMGAGSIFLILRLNRIQVEEQDKWKLDVPGVKQETVRIPAVRGNIVDRDGRILASNQLNYELDINLEEVKRIYQQNWESTPQSERVGRREEGMATVKRETDIAAIARATILPQLEKFGLDKKVSDRALRIHYSTHKGLIGFNYSSNLNFDQFCLLSENIQSLPGAEVSVRPKRIYPYESLAGHLLGYTKPWKKGEIPEYEKNLYSHYKGDHYGDSGIEYTMNEYLKGAPGKTTIERGPKGIYRGVLNDLSTPAITGAEVQLTLDSRIQCYLEKLLRNVGRGGATVIDIETGEIVAMATVPSMNPNDYIPVITQDKYNYYKDNRAAPFLNNAIQQHQPGSVFKLPVALAAAQANALGFQNNCVGYNQYGRDGHKIHCWKTVGHGTLNMTSAIQRSCNPYFMSLANNLGGKQVVDMFGLLGFGKKTGISVTGEESGLVPGSLNWKRYTNPGEAFTPATLAQLSIGQAQSSCSTLQMACATAAIANNGIYMRPRIIKSVTHPTNGEVVEDIPQIKLDLKNEGVSYGSIQTIKKGMWRAANEQGGTAGRAKFSDTIEVAGKTGTAQTYEFGKKSNNAWTTAFAPYDSPKYAVCAVVIGGRSGGKVAGPIVRETFRALFAEEIPEPEPLENYAGNINEIEELILEPLFEEPTLNE